MSCQSHLQPHLPVLDMISLETILSIGTQIRARCHFDKARSLSCRKQIYSPDTYPVGSHTHQTHLIDDLCFLIPVHVRRVYGTVGKRRCLAILCR
ncbi:Uncharacterized protein HZ326_2836 [Fusarium oxysporum f. sp. albedinis]|nr:Uncharacterized protein HZ326_2836 [Fusarium oxysporum f. sp. albedinis]